MKSAYELAMERLAKSDPEGARPLTPEQKARLAEIDRVHQGKLAEREIFLKKQLDDAYSTYGNRIRAWGKERLDETYADTASTAIEETPAENHSAATAHLAAIQVLVFDRHAVREQIVKPAVVLDERWVRWAA